MYTESVCGVRTHTTKYAESVLGQNCSRAPLSTPCVGHAPNGMFTVDPYESNSQNGVRRCVFVLPLKRGLRDR